MAEEKQDSVSILRKPSGMIVVPETMSTLEDWVTIWSCLTLPEILNIYGQYKILVDKFYKPHIQDLSFRKVLSCLRASFIKTFDMSSLISRYREIINIRHFSSAIERLFNQFQFLTEEEQKLVLNKINYNVLKPIIYSNLDYSFILNTILDEEWKIRFLLDLPSQEFEKISHYDIDFLRAHIDSLKDAERSEFIKALGLHIIFRLLDTKIDNRVGFLDLVDLVLSTVDPLTTLKEYNKVHAYEKFAQYFNYLSRDYQDNLLKDLTLDKLNQFLKLYVTDLPSLRLIITVLSDTQLSSCSLPSVCLESKNENTQKDFPDNVTLIEGLPKSKLIQLFKNPNKDWLTNFSNDASKVRFLLYIIENHIEAFLVFARNPKIIDCCMRSVKKILEKLPKKYHAHFYALFFVYVFDRESNPQDQKRIDLIKQLEVNVELSQGNEFEYSYRMDDESLKLKEMMYFFNLIPDERLPRFIIEVSKLFPFKRIASNVSSLSLLLKDHRVYRGNINGWDQNERREYYQKLKETKKLIIEQYSVDDLQDMIKTPSDFETIFRELPAHVELLKNYLKTGRPWVHFTDDFLSRVGAHCFPVEEKQVASTNLFSPNNNAKQAFQQARNESDPEARYNILADYVNNPANEKDHFRSYLLHVLQLKPLGYLYSSAKLHTRLAMGI